MELITLYKQDEKGKIRVWWMEIEEDRYRVNSGIKDGKIVQSGWKTAKPKNVGKANETTGELQAQFEVQSEYTKQREQGGYFETIEEAMSTTVFDCMLAEDWHKQKGNVSSNVFSQPKLDGVRCNVSKDFIQSRQKKPFLSVPHIKDILNQICTEYSTLIVDGELYNHKLKAEFEKIVSLVRKSKPTDEDIRESYNLVEYHVYDVYFTDKPEMPFSERLAFINEKLSNIPFIVPVQTSYCESAEALDALNAEYIEMGYEGQMVRLDAPYETKRSKTLMKRKSFEDIEVEILRLEEGEGNWAGAVKIAHIRHNGIEQKSGIRGKYEDLAKILEEAELYEGGEGTCRFQGRTADGLLRFPVITYLWKGKRDL